MALRQARLTVLFGRGCILSTRQSNLVALTSVEGHRNLTTDPTYKKPFPYKTKKFTFLRSLFEFTCARLNENSRIVMVEGLPCVGKTEFAKSLAENFKLKYLPAIKEEDVFIQNGFDKRELNDMMPSDRMKIYDLDSFYAGLEPEKKLYFGNMQIGFFQRRWAQYREALRHVLNTGQGVVLENSVFSDAVYALNLADHGYFSRKGIRWYMEYRENCLFNFWKPHLIINLDAPSSHIVKKMKEKYPKYENSPVLKESYFDGYKEKFNQFYLPFMREYCDTLYYNVLEMEDLDLLFMDLESMDLISSRFGESWKFTDWHKQKEEQWSLYRLLLESPRIMENMQSWRGPWNIPEFVMSGEEFDQLHDIYGAIPQLSYPDKYWQDKNGELIDRQELKEITPLSLASDDPTCNQGAPSNRISA